MAPSIPTTVPTALTAGADWQWTQTFPDFDPADASACVYYFSGPASFSITATVGADDFSVAVAASTTAAYTAGLYSWVARVTVSGVVYDADSGTLDLLADPATTGDQSSFAAQMVSNIEAELLARVTGDGSGHDSYSIAGGGGSRSLAKISVRDLQMMLAQYRAQLAMERNGGTLPPYAVRFGRAS